MKTTHTLRSLALAASAGLILLALNRDSSAQQASVQPHPSGGILPLSVATVLDVSLLRALATEDTVAGPALVDINPQSAVAATPLWQPGGVSVTNLNPSAAWTITAMNLGTAAVIISGPSGSKTIGAGESWSLTSQPSQNDTFSYEVPNAGHAKFAWAIRQHQ